MTSGVARGCLAGALIAVGACWAFSLGDRGDFLDAVRALRAWPAVLVAAGLDMLLAAGGRRLGPRPAAAVVASVVLVLHLPTDLGTDEQQPASRLADVEPSEGTYDLEVDLAATHAGIRHAVLPESPMALEAEWEGVEPVVESGPGRVVVRDPGSRWAFLDLGRRENDLRLALPYVPVRMALRTTGSRVFAMIGSLPVLSVGIDALASDVEIVLPHPDAVIPVRVDAGASSVRVNVPRDAGVRLRAPDGWNGIVVRDIDLVDETAGERVTPGFDHRRTRFDVTVRSRLSRVLLVEQRIR